MMITTQVEIHEDLVMQFESKYGVHKSKTLDAARMFFEKLRTMQNVFTSHHPSLAVVSTASALLSKQLDWPFCSATTTLEHSYSVGLLAGVHFVDRTRFFTF